MTDIVSRARAALDGTTEGPWKSRDPYDGCGDLEHEVEVFADKPGDRIAYHSIAEVQSRSGDEDDPEMVANAEFIAWARTGVPALIAEVESLRVALGKRIIDHADEVESLRVQIAAVQALADRIERESQAPGTYSEIRRAHATMIRLALNGEQAS